MKTKSNSRRLGIAAIAGVVFLLGGFIPAQAASGSASGVIEVTLTPDPSKTSLNPICVFLNQTGWASISYQGTYTDPNTGANYTGPLNLNVDVGAFENPAGSYTSPQGCVVPGPVAIRSATVTGSNASGSVSCTYSTGQYERVGGQWNYVLDGQCSVDGGPPTLTTEVITGSQLSCDHSSGNPYPDSCQVDFTSVITNV